MAKFNTLAAKQDSSSSSSGADGIYPSFEADPSYNGPNADATHLGVNAYAVGGYDNNGDYILLPTTSTASMTYYDNTGAQVTTGAWSGGILHTDIDASSDAWVGFMLDDTESVLYVCTVDTTATPDKFNLASITKAGVITNISAAGGTAVTTDFTSSPTWGANATTSGTSCLYRTSDGVGNLTVSVYGSNEVEHAVFNVSTGALVTDTTSVKSIQSSAYSTPAGNYIGGFVGATGSGTFSSIIHAAGRAVTSDFIARNTGLGFSASNGAKALQWGGRIVLGGYAGSIFGPRAYSVNEFDAKVDELCAAMGCEV